MPVSSVEIDRDDERAAPDLADRLGGELAWTTVKPFRFECARDLFALRADFIDDKDRRHRDLTIRARCTYHPDAAHSTC